MPGARAFLLDHYTSARHRWSGSALRSTIQMMSGGPVGGCPTSVRGERPSRHNLVGDSLDPYLLRRLQSVQTELYGLHPSEVHCSDSFPVSNDDRKFLVGVVIVHPSIALTAAITNPKAVGAAARLGTDSKRRQYAGPTENLHWLVSSRASRAKGFIDTPTIHSFRIFDTSTHGPSVVSLVIACAIPIIPCREATLNCSLCRQSLFYRRRIRATGSPRLRSLGSVASPHPSFEVRESQAERNEGETWSVLYKPLRDGCFLPINRADAMPKPPRERAL